MLKHPDFAYIHPRKCAGKLISEFLESEFSDAEYIEHPTQHIPADEVIAPFKFSTVRNPYSWYVSWWAFARDRREQLFSKEFREKEFHEWLPWVMERDEGSEHDVNFAILNQLGIGAYTFRLFEVLSHPLIVSRGEYEVKVDKVIKMEDLPHAFFEVMESIGYPLTNEQKRKFINWKKPHPSPHKPFQEYYTKELADLVLEKDYRIFEMFDYKMNSWKERSKN